MKLNLLREWLSWFKEYSSEYNPSIISSFDDCPGNNLDNYDASSSNTNKSNNTYAPSSHITQTKFIPTRKLCKRYNLIIGTLNSVSSIEGSTISFCVADPLLPYNPIVYTSDGFCHLMGYKYEEVVGRNYMILQRPETKREGVEFIIGAIK